MENTGRLKDFRFELRHCIRLFDISDKQIAVAQNIHRSFGIPEKSIINLIVFTGYILRSGEKSTRGFNYSFIREISEFLPAAGQIKAVTFSGESKSLSVTNPELTARLMEALIGIIDNLSANKVADPADPRFRDKNIKNLAGELYEELVRNEKLTPWRALCVVGYIFLLFELKLESEEALLNESEFLNKMKATGDTAKSYLNYLSDRIKSYIEE
jgi:hypothetical protein